MHIPNSHTKIMQHYTAQHCATVPRKRRPRAVGEVSITSHSSVYVNHTSETPINSVNITDQPEPVYQNAAPIAVLLPRHRRANKGAKTKKLRDVGHFVVFTVNGGGCCDKVDQSKNDSMSSVDETCETQFVTVFIGKSDHHHNIKMIM